MKIRLLARILIALSLIPANGNAQELVGGWEGGSGNGYAFVAPIFSFPKSGEGAAWVVRPSASYLYYETRDAAGVTDVRSPGAALSIAWRWRTPQLTVTLGPGFESRWERRTLPSGAVISNTRTGVTVAADAYWQATPLTRLIWSASYGDSDRYYWSRVGFARQLATGDSKNKAALAVGADVTVQGNPDITRHQAGGLLEVNFLQARSSLQLRAGYSQSRNAGATESHPYLALGFYSEW